MDETRHSAGGQHALLLCANCDSDPSVGRERSTAGRAAREGRLMDPDRPRAPEVLDAPVARERAHCDPIHPRTQAAPADSAVPMTPAVAATKAAEWDTSDEAQSRGPVAQHSVVAD